MRYIKGDQTYKLGDLSSSKMMLEEGDDPIPENIWVKISPNGKEAILQNHALCFYMFPSWGAVLPATSHLNITSIKEKQELTLHPEAWEEYLKHGTIDENGNFNEPLSTN